MKQYMLAVHGTQGDPPPAPDALQEMFADVEKVNQEMRDKGAWVFAGGLTDPSDATVVRVEHGKVMTTDGPYGETKEQLGGFWVINAENLDEALAWAQKATVACRGPVEVRPFQDEPGS
ncbi:MAG TPA: YciI family protein [Pseudonocardia sp.]